MKLYTPGNGESIHLNYCLVSDEEVETVMNEMKKEIEAATQSANDDL